MSYSRVQYKFINNDTGRELLLDTPQSADPINWENSEKTLKRSTKNFGIMTELSKDLEFVKESKVFLDTAYLIKGIEASVTMEEWKAYPNQDGYYLHSTGLFDFSEYKTDKLRTKIPFKTGGLNAKIAAQLKEKFELERLESITGDVIEELPKIDLNLSAREILLISKLETSELDRVSSTFRMAFNARPNNRFRSGSLAIPVNVVINSDENIQNVFRDQSFTTTPDDGEVLSMFYLNNDRAKTIQLKIEMFSIVRDIEINDLRNEFLRVDLVRFGGGDNLNIISRTTLQSVSFPVNYKVFSIYYQTDLTINTGESLSLQWHGGGDFGSFFSRGELDINFTNTKATIDITEKSTFPDTPTKATRFHEVGDKIVQIITGQKCFYSEFFGRTDLGYTNNGEFSNVAFSLGFWIRQFFDKKLQFSLGDYLETANAIFNTGYGIEIINGKETLVVEDLKYFFQEQVGISLPNQVTNVEREVATEYYHSSIEIGYEKPDGDNLYEESMGLDEYNGKRSFTEPITRVDTTYKKLSKARADRYGIEFARRKPQSGFPQQDTRYDSSVFLFDLKEEIGMFRERFWGDDYEFAPTGVFSPDTASNLRLTPFRNLERHGWFFGAGLQKYPDDKVRFSSSTLNSKLTTKKVGEPARSEDGDILISDLERPRFVPEWVTFEHPVDFAVNEMVYGKTNVMGRMIPNYYFKVQFINEYGQKEYGYLFELKPNKEGKWKVLTANI